MYYAPQDDALFCGDCLVNGYLPSLDCGTTADWQEWLVSLDRIARLGAGVVVSGHGAVAFGDDVKRLIEAVRAELERSIATGLSPTSHAASHRHNVAERQCYALGKAARMSFQKALGRLACGIAFLTALYGFQKSFREYPGVEYENFPLPPDFQEKTEWAFARLMYPSAPGARFVRRYNRHGGSDWTQGSTSWTQDYPRADRHFSLALRRLTRIHVRSVEQPVNLDDGDDVYRWPWLYAVQVGEWRLSDAQAKTLREYLLRGGFFMCDDFWGAYEWEVFEESMKRVFPDRPIVDIEDSDAIFHTIYDLDNRYQVPGQRYVRTGQTAKCQGCPALWRGIYDDKGRLMVAMTFDSDLGDSWEWADYPEYPEKFSALGIRIGVNYVVYAMTH